MDMFTLFPRSRGAWRVGWKQALSRESFFCPTRGAFFGLHVCSFGSGEGACGDTVRGAREAGVRQFGAFLWQAGARPAFLSVSQHTQTAFRKYCPRAQG